MPRPIAIDLFAGAGGMSLGFEQAGFDVVAAVEIDPVHCATHKFNFPETVIIPKSVVGLTGHEIRKHAGILDRQVDCVFGGPPCQGFSLIGQRSLEDPRNNLVLDFVRIVAELDASTFVFENVKGLTVGHQKNFLSELIEAFKAVGYDVQLPWKVLSAANFGVPQHRERLILMGAKKEEHLPYYPQEITNGAGSKKQIKGLPIGPTCLDALSDLPNADEFKALLDTDSIARSKFGKPSRYAAELRCLTERAWHHGYVRGWNQKVLTSSMRTVHTNISRRRFKQTVAGQVEPISRFFKLPPNGLSNTLRAGTDSARGAFTSPRPIHYKFPRCITVREMARLHGYPDWFRFHVTKWHGARQIGNSVPPPLARAIAASVFAAIGKRLIRPKRTIQLTDSFLLKLDMSEASKFFGITPPIQKRDKKTGSKKRKQIEIERERIRRKAA
jgi:DNA (cytosine-5)-methyltransferase 1